MLSLRTVPGSGSLPGDAGMLPVGCGVTSSTATRAKQHRVSAARRVESSVQTQPSAQFTVPGDLAARFLAKDL